jgi:hypothetical protein
LIVEFLSFVEADRQRGEEGSSGCGGSEVQPVRCTVHIVEDIVNTCLNLEEVRGER